MMNVEEIEKEIEKYQKGENKKHWQNKNIDITIKGKKTSFNVNGFGICENDNFSIESSRYYLEFEIINPKGNKGSIVSIMMNPSDQTNPDNQTIDNTVTNVIRMAYVSGYSKVIILNSFPYINGNDDESLTQYDKLKKDKDKTSHKIELNINKEFIGKFLENQNKQDILLAWGGDMKNTKEDYAEILKKYEDKIFVYNITSDDDFPMHPSPKNQKEVNKILNGEKKLKKVQLILGDNRRKKIAVAYK